MRHILWVLQCWDFLSAILLTEKSIYYTIFVCVVKGRRKLLVFEFKLHCIFALVYVNKKGHFWPRLSIAFSTTGQLFIFKKSVSILWKWIHIRPQGRLNELKSFLALWALWDDFCAFGLRVGQLFAPCMLQCRRLVSGRLISVLTTMWLTANHAASQQFPPTQEILYEQIENLYSINSMNVYELCNIRKRADKNKK